VKSGEEEERMREKEHGEGEITISEGGAGSAG